MHLGDLTLGPDMASCTKLSIVCASSESCNDLTVLGKMTMAGAQTNLVRTVRLFAV